MAKVKKQAAPEKIVTGEEQKQEEKVQGAGTQEQKQETKKGKVETKATKVKQECPADVSLMERNILSACVRGAWPQVSSLLSNYKWRDLQCARIAGSIRYCTLHNIAVNVNSVQLVLLRIYPDTYTDIKYVTDAKIEPNTLVPRVKQLLNTK